LIVKDVILRLLSKDLAAEFLAVAICLSQHGSANQVFRWVHGQLQKDMIWFPLWLPRRFSAAMPQSKIQPEFPQP
jgi:hypothetical protein